MNVPAEVRALRVLVVGGKPASVQILRTAFGLIGLRDVNAVSDSARAIEALRMQHFSAIFADPQTEPFEGMPFHLAARRANGILNPMTPLFLIYQHARQRNVENARDEGVTDVLTHPVSAATIARKLGVVTTKPRSFIAAPTFFGPDRRAERRGGVWTGDERRKRIAKKTKVTLAEAPVTQGDFTFI